MAEAKVKRMWALPGAELTVPRSLLMHGGDQSLVTVPCPSYLIEHPKGLVLFDTGCHPKVVDDAVGYWGEIAATCRSTSRRTGPSTTRSKPSATSSRT